MAVHLEQDRQDFALVHIGLTLADKQNRLSDIALGGSQQVIDLLAVAMAAKLSLSSRCREESFSEQFILR